VFFDGPHLPLSLRASRLAPLPRNRLPSLRYLFRIAVGARERDRERRRKVQSISSGDSCDLCCAQLIRTEVLIQAMFCIICDSGSAQQCSEIRGADRRFSLEVHKVWQSENE
jgi:hypothetical protein